MINNKVKRTAILIILLAVLSFGESSKNSEETTKPKEAKVVRITEKSKKETNTENEEQQIRKKKKQNRNTENEDSKDKTGTSHVNKKNNEKTVDKESTVNNEKNGKTGKEREESPATLKNEENVNSTKKNKTQSKSEKNTLNSDKLKSQKDKDKNKEDKKKAVMAEEKEIEGISRYKGEVHKFIATKDGKILKNGTENIKHPTASLAKVMNIVVALDQVDRGNANLDDNVCFTPETANLKGSWLNVKVGDCFKLRDLLRAEIIYSANNAAYLVAYHIGKGNIDNFVQLMNQKAQELGMSSTEFYTPAGLPTSMTGKKMDTSTAYDMYLLGKKAVEDERIKEWSAEPELILPNSKGEEVIYKNRNILLFRHGIYGLKTGFHGDAGYNLIAASRLGNIEIISVTLGNQTEEDRTKDQKSEFSRIENRLKPVYSAGKDMGAFKIINGKKKEVKGVVAENIYQIDNTKYTFNVKDFNVDVEGKGIKKGDRIGEVEVRNNGYILSKVDIVSEEDVESLSLFGKFLRYVTFGWL